MKHWKAIAAMSLNRVIGRQGAIPWHLPEDFKWFKQQTTGNVAVMGRKTYESLPGRLPNRRIMVLTRHPRRLIREHPETYGAFREWRGGQSICLPYQLRFPRVAPKTERDLLLVNALERIRPERFPCEVFICGGAEVYAQALPRCSDLFLTRVQREIPDGDAFFPPFEEDFEWVADLRVTPEFRIQHYRNRRLA